MADNNEALAEAWRATQERVLAAPMNKKATGASSVGDFLHQCLLELWSQQEGFSGKRPLGDSGWNCDIAHALVKDGILTGKLDEDGDLLDYNRKDLDRLMRNAINHLFAREKR